MDERRIEMKGPAGNVMVLFQDIARGLANGFEFCRADDAEEFKAFRRAHEEQIQAQEDDEREDFPAVIEWTSAASVFVVESGEYSDRCVEAVFTSEDGAKRWVADHHDDEHMGRLRITEFPLDPTRRELPPGHVLWSVVMRRDGAVEQTRWVRSKVHNPIVYPDTFVISDSPNEWLTALPEGPTAHREFFITARDREHAVKVANERRAQMIAENLWPEANSD